MADINKLVPLIFKWEGNWSNNKNDKGGATNMGITLSTWKSQGYDKDSDGDIDINDLKLVTKQDVIEILRKNYWNRWHADQIQNQSIANLLVDWVWNSGVHGIKIPQSVLDVTIDGSVGNKTIDSTFVHQMYGNKYLGVDYNKFIPYLVSGINEIDTEVTILKKKINRLEKRISELEHLN